jgi:hypothetical protein
MFREAPAFWHGSPCADKPKGTAMRKIHEVKGQRYIVGYDRETGQFVETLVPYAELGPDIEETAEIVQFPELAPAETQPLRKAG